MSDKKSFTIYTSGLCKMSVCTDIDSEEEIELRANQEQPTGIASQWVLSSDPTFSGGQTNPCQCDQDGTKKHWLLEC